MNVNTNMSNVNQLNKTVKDVQPESLDSKKRGKRFTKPLISNGIEVFIPDNWHDIPKAPKESHDQKFVEILKKHGLDCASPVPLVGRYSKSRSWSLEELQACLKAHSQGIPLGIMSAALNRNPQDIIYRLLDALSDKSENFKEVGIKNSQAWNKSTINAGRELFEAGLTAWRIAAFFGVDFEGVEKTLYKGRDDYGHAKKNPFAICTEHKQIVNTAILKRIPSLRNVLDAFAGEGKLTRLVETIHPQASIHSIEIDPITYERAMEDRDWSKKSTWYHSDNLLIMQRLIESNEVFDLVDLDPFVSCREQIDLLWPLLKSESYCFLTFGGEYRRSFIGTNRKAIARRYGFFSETLSNSEYLEEIPSYFFGWFANEAAKNGFTFEIEYCVRYPNNCRFWLKMTKQELNLCLNWINSHIEEINQGFKYRSLVIPRYSEVRYRVEELEAGIPYTPVKKKSSRKLQQKQRELNL